MRYQPASNNPSEIGCQTGTRALALAIKHVYPELESVTKVYGCFNRRRIEGSASWSLHAEGRASDVGVPVGRTELGWVLACDLVAHRVVYGIQRVMWDGHIWSVERIDEWQRLKPATDQHHDHIHLEQHWDGAKRPATVQSELEAALRRGR